MIKSNELAKNIWWVGAVDWDVRNFHGYTTEKGSTYNAYLIIDEKITLIDTVKDNLTQDLLDHISEIIDPSRIDYVISNHVEMDHSGSIPAVMKVAKNAELITSAPSGLSGLKAHFGDFNYRTVQSGDTLNLGSRTLEFVTVPMLHWPDSMMSYCPEEKILFSNDAFGQHYASSEHFDDMVPLDEALAQAAKYYANILLPFGAQAKLALEAAAKLDIAMIASSHGIIWRSHISEIIERYQRWSNNILQDKAVVVYGTMWHSTEKMAKAVVSGFKKAGIPVKLCNLDFSHISDIMADLIDAKYIAVGSPTLNNQMLPSVAAFLTYMKGLAPKSRSGFAFGSFGWGGQSVGMVENILKECGFDLLIPMSRIKYVPARDQLTALTDTIADALPKPVIKEANLPSIDYSAIDKISYGLFIASTMDGDRPVGCIINTCSQVTVNPATISIYVNKNNYTACCLRKHSRVSISILPEDTPATLIGTFGFKSSRDTDKFDGVDYSMRDDLPVLGIATSYITGTIIKSIDVMTHTIFIVQIDTAAVQTGNTPMTYDYYRTVIKGKSPKNAPTYRPPAQVNTAEKPTALNEYVCPVCGYVHKVKGDLPAGFSCPTCGISGEKFTKKI